MSATTSIKIWKDERAKDGEKWAVTSRLGSVVMVFRYATRGEARVAAARMRKDFGI